MSDDITAPPRRQHSPENMGSGTGHLIGFCAFLLPAAALTLLGRTIGDWHTALGLGLLWIGVFSVACIKVRRKKTALVVERFGMFWRVKFAGPRIVIPGIDFAAKDIDMLQQSVALFAKKPQDVEHDNPERMAIDFIDGSAPVIAYGWYQVVDPKALKNNDWEVIEQQVLDYTYIVQADDLPARVADIYENEFRPLLAGKTINEAETGMADIALTAVNNASPILQNIGVYPFPNKGITVRDLDLPEAIIKFRQQQLQGRMNAQEIVEESRGLWEPVLRMSAGLRGGLKDDGGQTTAEGIELTAAQIVDLYLKQRGLDVLRNVGKLDIVAPNIDGAIKAITIASTTNGGA